MKFYCLIKESMINIKKNIKRVSKESMITKQEMKFKLISLYKYINY